MPQRDLVRGSDRLQTIRVGEVRDRPNLAWAEGLSFCVPSELVRRTGLDRRRTGSGEVIISGDTNAPDSTDCDRLRMLAAYTQQPTSSRLPFSYRRIPGWMRSPVLWGLWWGVLILLMLAFSGQTSKFLYVDF